MYYAFSSMALVQYQYERKNIVASLLISCQKHLTSTLKFWLIEVGPATYYSTYNNVLQAFWGQWYQVYNTLIISFKDLM